MTEPLTAHTPTIRRPLSYSAEGLVLCPSVRYLGCAGIATVRRAKANDSMKPRMAGAPESEIVRICSERGGDPTEAQS